MSKSPATPDASAEALMGEAVDEFLTRLGRGERPEVEQYARRYPPLATVLRHMLPALQAMHSSATEQPRTGIEPEGPLGDFRLVREIGRGGMGVVYEAVQISLGRRVALKVLPFAAALDARQLQRFKNEAQAAAHLHHQNIVPVYAVGCERGVHFYAMQYIEGHTLAALIQELRSLAGLELEVQVGPRAPVSEVASERPSARWVPAQSPSTDFQLPCSSLLGMPEATGTRRVPAAPAADTLSPLAAAVSTELSTRNPTFFRTIAGLGMQAAKALEHAHRLGVIHRDVKPANLMVDGQGNPWVTDFGLAQMQTDPRLTLTGDLVGTLRYMSPEQAVAQPTGVDHRTDLYSLGATLYELLTLEPAFTGRDHRELLQQIALEEPKPLRRLNKAVPAELETIVLKAMAKNPGERYATAQELADDLERFLRDEPIRAKRPTAVQWGRKWARRHRSVVWSAAGSLFVAVAVLAGSIGWVMRDRAVRQARTVTAVQDALARAQDFLREGEWPEAQAAARRAEALLADGGGQELQRAVAGVFADLHMVARLEEVRLRGSGVRDGHFDLEGEADGYAAAFRDYGIDIDVGTLAPGEAAERIRARQIRVELAAALDGWARARRWARSKGGKSWQELLAIARAADPDPGRAPLRDALLRGDRRALVRQAADQETRALPQGTLLLLAESLAATGGLQEATALLRRAQEQYPGDFWINHKLAFYLVRASPPPWNEAIPFYMAAVALRPDSAGARLNLGSALAGQGRLDEALAAARKAIELKPDYAEAHCNLGNALAGKGRLDEALTACRRAIELKPGLAEAHLNLGRALTDNGQFDEALTACRRAIELKGDYAEAYNNLGRALQRQGRLDEAVAACRHAIELKPGLVQAHFNLGLALIGQGQFDEALDAYRKVIELKPDDPEAHCNLGVVLDRKGRLDEAMAAYGQAASLKPGLIRAHHNLGRALQRMGRSEEAVAAFRRVLDLNPDCAEADYDLGNALCEQHRLDEAVAAYRRVIELKPDYAEAYCNLGGALRQQGEFAQALAAMERGHELGSRRPDWPYPSARWVKEYEPLGELRGRLPAVLRGEAQPANAAEWNAYALLCYDKKLHAAAARLRASALTADPRLGDDVEAGYRYEAACAATVAGCGQGEDIGQLDDKERARWRKQALEWLRADLEAYGKQLDSTKQRDRQLVLHRLRGWQDERDLAGLRDPAVVARLPANEQEACKQLWADVQALLIKAEAAR